jgi:serine protease Do
MGAIRELESKIAGVAGAHGEAVVGIGRGWRFGSGTVVERDRVLASAHQVRSDQVPVTLAPGQTGLAEVAGIDHDLGVAVLRVDTGGLEPPAWAADGSEVGIGTAVIALANPGGRGLRACPGFVAAPERSLRGPRGRRISGALEHTATLPRGSAGGPLLDLEGRLLGVNVLRLEGGLIVALGPGSGLREAVERLGRGEERARPHLGVAVAPAHVARRMRRAVGLPEQDGLLVRGVEDESAAARAGLARGDLIVAAAGERVDGIDALHRALDRAAGQGGLSLTVIRGTDERKVGVELDGGGG